MHYPPGYVCFQAALAYSKLSTVQLKGYRDQCARPIHVLFQTCHLNTVNELFQLLVQRECFIEGVCFLSMCMKANVFVSNTKKVITSVCVSCYCVFVLKQMPGPWVAYG